MTEVNRDRMLEASCFSSVFHENRFAKNSYLTYVLFCFMSLAGTLQTRDILLPVLHVDLLFRVEVSGADM